MSLLSPVRDHVDHWFSEYFNTFISIGAGKMNPREILLYWGVPLHTSNPRQRKWLTSSEEVVAVLNEMQSVLKQLGYTHTEILDKTITIYNENAARVDTIMSRRREDEAEIDRAAVSFELRRDAHDWIMISTTLSPTEATSLQDAWYI